MIKITLLKKLLEDVREEITDRECSVVNSAIVDCCTYLIEELKEIAMITNEDLRRDFLKLQLLVVQLRERVEKLEEEKIKAISPTGA